VGKFPLTSIATMKIFLRPPESKSRKDDLEIDLNPDELIESLRKKISEKKGIDCFKLVFNGKTLHAESTLRSYKVEEGATIMTEPQYHGQYLPMGVQPGMEKRTAEEAELVSELAPEAKRAATAMAAENISEAQVAWCGIQA